MAVRVWVIVTANAVAWLSRIVPALISGGPAAFLRGSGLPTNPVYVQDLALWLPLIAVAAAWLWRRRLRGHPVIGATVVYLVLEAPPSRWTSGSVMRPTRARRWRPRRSRRSSGRSR